MTPQEAIRLLDPTTTRDALWQIEYYGGFNGKEAQVAVIEEACLLAVEALKRMTSGEWVDVYMNSPSSYAGTCSACRVSNDIPPPQLAHYCPNCGAKMEENP